MSTVQVLCTDKSWIAKTPGVCGGRACIRTTRMPVWSLVRSRSLGLLDEELCNRFVVPLTQADLDAAWMYYEQNREEIDRDIRENEES